MAERHREPEEPTVPEPHEDTHEPTRPPRGTRAPVIPETPEEAPPPSIPVPEPEPAPEPTRPPRGGREPDAPKMSETPHAPEPPGPPEHPGGGGRAPEVTEATGDARYDQARKVCVCGGGYFVPLQVGQVHTTQSYPFMMVLPPLQVQSQADEVARLPMVECIKCRTRYDREWREVV